MFGLFKKKEKPLVRSSFKGKEAYYCKNNPKAKEFIALGGGLSGIYDVSNKNTMSIVRKYSEFIKPQHIYKRNEKGILIPYFSKDRKVERKKEDMKNGKTWRISRRNAW